MRGRLKFYTDIRQVSVGAYFTGTPPTVFVKRRQLYPVNAMEAAPHIEI